MLDPSISLDYQAPQMPDFSKYAQQAMNTAVGAQQIQASQQAQATSAAQEQNLQAQNPGLVAQSNSLEAKAALDQQDKAAMDYANSIAPKYTTHNADGSVTFDALSAGNDMAANGFVKQGGQYVKQWADGVSANTDSIKKLQDNTADLQKSQLQMAGPILNAAAQEPDPVKEQHYLIKDLQEQNLVTRNYFQKVLQVI